MSVYDNLIFDRSQEDVDRLAELKTKISTLTADADEIQEWLDGDGSILLYSSDEVALYDVDEGAIYAMYTNILKGAYNYNDLNRVGAAMLFVKNEATAAGYTITFTTNPRTDWTVDEIPTLAEMNNYIACIRAIRSGLPYTSTTPEAPTSANNLTYATANNIEKILYDAREIIGLATGEFKYAGNYYAGE